MPLLPPLAWLISAWMPAMLGAATDVPPTIPASSKAPLVATGNVPDVEPVRRGACARAPGEGCDIAAQYRSRSRRLHHAQSSGRVVGRISVGVAQPLCSHQRV